MNVSVRLARRSCLGLAALLALTLAAGTVRAQSYTWTQTAAGTYTWGASPSNWGSGFPNATGDTANLNINLSGSQTINLDQVITIGTLNIGDTTSTFSGVNIAAGTGGSLILDVTSGSATISKATSGNNVQDVISADIQLNDALAITNATTNTATVTLNLSGVISESGGARGVTINGAGRTFLSGTANTFSGAVNVLNGGLFYGTLGSASSSSSLGTSGAINLGSGANTVLLRHNNTSADITDRAITLTGNGGIVELGNGWFSDGGISNAGALTFNGNFTNSTGTTTLRFNGLSTAGAITVNGRILDSGAGVTSVNPLLNNTITFSATNSTYTGKTTLTNQAGNPTWRVTKLANAGLESSFGAATGANATIDMGISNNGLHYVGTTDSATDRSINLIGGGGRYTILTSTASTTLTFNGDFQSSFTSNSVLWFDGYASSSNNRQGKIVVNGKLVDSGTRSLGIRIDDGMNTDFVTLTGLSTYTGTTTVERNAILTVNSIKDLGQASALGAPTTTDAGRVQLGGSGGTSTLRYNGTGDTTNRQVQVNSDSDGRGGRIEMAGSGTLKFTSNVISAGANSALLTIQGATSGVGEIAGIISSATAVGKTTSLLKSGTGTWVLSGNNTYTGTTGISAGQLFINGNQASATGAVTVAAGAALGGSGTVGGATTFSGASLLRPGSSGVDTGVLAFASNLTLSTTGTSFIDITGATRGSLYDGVNVSGTLAYGGRLQFAIASLITGTFDIFNFTGGLSSGSFASIAGSISGTTLSFTNASGVWTAPFTIGSTSGTATFTQSTGDLVIVPEPGAWALAVVGCSGLVWLASRRRRTKAVAP